MGIDIFLEFYKVGGGGNKMIYRENRSNPEESRRGDDPT